jgi:hypothetical protein
MNTCDFLHEFLILRSINHLQSPSSDSIPKPTLIFPRYFPRFLHVLMPLHPKNVSSSQEGRILHSGWFANWEKNSEPDGPDILAGTAGAEAETGGGSGGGGGEN